MVSAMAHFLLQQPSGPRDADTTLRNVLMVPVIAEQAEFNARFGTRTCTVFNMTEISVPIASGWIESANCFRAIRIVEQVGPSQVVDLPLQREFGVSLANQPAGDRKDFVFSEDSFRSPHSPEIVD